MPPLLALPLLALPLLPLLPLAIEDRQVAEVEPLEAEVVSLEAEKAALVDETVALFAAETEALSARDALLELKAALVAGNGGLGYDRDGLLTEKAVPMAEVGDDGGLGDSGRETVKETAMAIVVESCMCGNVAHTIVRYN